MTSEGCADTSLENFMVCVDGRSPHLALLRLLRKDHYSYPALYCSFRDYTRSRQQLLQLLQEVYGTFTL